MSRISSKNALLLTEQLYRILLFVYPVTHRREYGPLMVQLFGDLCRDSYREKGFIGLVKLWSHVLTDTAVTATVEHFYALQEGGQLMTRKQHWMVLSLAGLPLELGVLLYLINPAFIGQMFRLNAAQPVGWMMVAAVFILVGTAYVVQRRIMVLLNGHYGKGLLFACSILLLVCPAMLLVVFGPAVVTVLRAGLYP